MSSKELSKISRVTKLLLDCKGWSRLKEVKAIIMSSFGLSVEQFALVLIIAKAFNQLDEIKRGQSWETQKNN